MSYTIFTANPTALIPQPGRAVNTFPSGLVRVDQTYIGLTSHAATHRATLAVGNNMPDGNSSPCIDGLKIFPVVQERRREDGFTEFLVSAYGRANSTGSRTLSKRLGEFTVRYDVTEARGFPPPVPVSSQHPAISDFLVWKFVTPVGAAPNVEISDTLTVFRTTGTTTFLLSEIFNRTDYNTPHESIPPTDSLSLGQNKRIALAENSNYGAFDEWTVAWVATPPELLDFGDYFRVFPPHSDDREVAIDLCAPTQAYTGTTNFSLVYNLDEGHSYEVEISKIENYQMSTGVWGAPIPAGVATVTTRGGAILWTATSFNASYTIPQVTRPTGQTGVIGSIHASNGFEWLRISPAPYWQFQPATELFRVTLRNERGGTTSHNVLLNFIDSEFPAAT